MVGNNGTWVLAEILKATHSERSGNGLGCTGSQKTLVVSDIKELARTGLRGTM